MEPRGIDSQTQKPNYNLEICDALRRGFPNSNCIGFPLPAVHRVRWTNLKSSEPWCRKNLQYSTVGANTIQDAILQAIELDKTL